MRQPAIAPHESAYSDLNEIAKIGHTDVVAKSAHHTIEVPLKFGSYLTV